MKSCIVVTRFFPSQPGYLDFAYRIQALSRHYKVTMISDHAVNVPEMNIDRVERVVLPGGTSTVGLLRYVWAVSRFIRWAKPDVVVLLHAMAAPLTYFLKGVPHVLYWNEHPIRLLGSDDASPLTRWFRAVKYHWLYIEAARRADLLMPIGEAHRDDLTTQGCMPAKVTLIYMGVDETFRGVALARQRQPDEPLELIYTGTVQKARGRDVMLEGVAQAVSSGVPVRLTMVGASPEELDYCDNYARELGIAEHVTVRGRVPGYEIPSFIARADAGICIWEDRPWWRFNPPTKLFEYLVAGLPVLASNIRTHTHYVRDGDNGLIFEYDARSLAEAIGRLWQQRSGLNAMKCRAFQSGQPYLWRNLEPVFLHSIADLAKSQR